MTLKRAFLPIALALVGCGGGGGEGDSAQTPPPPNAAVGGIWEGSSSTGEQLIGLVTETGEFQFISDAGIQYVGTLAVNGDALSNSFVAFSNDGAYAGSGTLTGTLQSRASASLNTSFTPVSGAVVNATIAFNYNALYERGSALAQIAGVYRELRTGVILSVDGSGVAFMQDPVSGCVVNGDATILDARYNAYRVSYVNNNCTGQFATLNGREFQGLATLDNAGVPERLIVGAATGGSANSRLGGVFIFERT